MSIFDKSAATSMSQELDDYDGRWVAVRDGFVVAHAVDEDRLLRAPAVRAGDLLYPIGDPAQGFYMINV
jgi:hypothetical protein